MNAKLSWIDSYITRQCDLLRTLPRREVYELIEMLHEALDNDRQIFVFGNGANAANASHFACDLGKGVSDSLNHSRFRIHSLNDNTPWMTAIGNDYCYEDVFVRQMQNYAQAGDLAISSSVSGNSPNCVKAMLWAAEHGLKTAAIVGQQRGQLADIADHSLVVADTHYGRVEDVQMTILHMCCFSFMEVSSELPENKSRL